jgi:hypothetical protein
VIAYRAMLDVPRELVREVAKLLHAERRARGTRTGSRALTCWNEALLVLAWFRNQGDVALVGAGFGVSRATAYRYRDEVVTVLAERAPDLHDALEKVSADGWSHVVVDGKVFRTDPCAETTLSAKGETINAWYSGKHRAPGGNVQAITRPDGLPIWVSDVVPGHQHATHETWPTGRSDGSVGQVSGGRREVSGGRHSRHRVGVKDRGDRRQRPENCHGRAEHQATGDSCNTSRDRRPQARDLVDTSSGPHRSFPAATSSGTGTSQPS